MDTGSASREEGSPKAASRYGLSKRAPAIPESKWEKSSQEPNAAMPVPMRSPAGGATAKPRTGFYKRCEESFVSFLFWIRRLMTFGEDIPFDSFPDSSPGDTLQRAELRALINRVQRELRSREASVGTLMAWEHFLAKLCDPDNLLSLRERLDFLKATHAQILGKTGRVQLQHPQPKPVTPRLFTVMSDRLHLAATRLRALSLAYHQDGGQPEEAKSEMCDHITERFDHCARERRIPLSTGIGLWEIILRHAAQGIVVNLPEMRTLLERLLAEGAAAQSPEAESRQAEINNLVERIQNLIDLSTTANMRRWYQFREHLREAPTLNHHEKAIVLQTIIDLLENAGQTEAGRVKRWLREAAKRLIGVRTASPDETIESVFEAMADMLDLSILLATTAEIFFTVIDDAAHATPPQLEQEWPSDPQAGARRALREENKERWGQFLVRFNIIADRENLSVAGRIELFELILDKISSREITSFATLNSDRKINAFIREWRRAQARQATEELLKQAGIERPAKDLLKIKETTLLTLIEDLQRRQTPVTNQGLREHWRQTRRAQRPIGVGDAMPGIIPNSDASADPVVSE